MVIERGHCCDLYGVLSIREDQNHVMTFFHFQNGRPGEDIDLIPIKFIENLIEIYKIIYKSLLYLSIS